MGINFRHPLALVAVAACGFAGCAGKSPFVQLAQDPTSMFRSAPVSPVVSSKPATSSSTDKSPFQSKHGAPHAKSENALTVAYKNAKSAVGNALTIKETVVPAADPVSLHTKPEKIKANVYVQAARLMESRGNFDAAIKQYEKAIAADDVDVKAFINFARLYDRQNQFEQAEAVYKKAIRFDRKSALAWNDLGLCYARYGELQKSIDALQKAVNLEPTKKRYRNNIATVLVEANQHGTAYAHLATVHSPEVANYNVGFLMAQRGLRDEAIPHFAAALESDFTRGRSLEMLHNLGESPKPTALVAQKPAVETQTDIVAEPKKPVPEIQQAVEQPEIQANSDSTDEDWGSAPAPQSPVYVDQTPADADQPPANVDNEPVYVDNGVADNDFADDGVADDADANPPARQPKSSYNDPYVPAEVIVDPQVLPKQYEYHNDPEPPSPTLVVPVVEFD